jgi:hypothetical protein
MKALVLAAAMLLAVRARADVTVEAIGQGTGYDTQPDAATRRASADAMRQAVDQVIGTLVAPEARKAAAQVIKTRLLRRARAYVKSQRTMDQGLVDGLWQVHLELTIDDVQLAKDLVALKIPVTRAQGEAPPVDAGRPRVVLIVVGEGLGDLAPAVAQELAARGIDVAALKVLETPIDDAQVAKLAAAASAPRGFLVNANLRPAGRIRGTPLHGVELVLGARLVSVDGGTRLLDKASRTGGAG